MVWLQFGIQTLPSSQKSHFKQTCLWGFHFFDHMLYFGTSLVQLRSIKIFSKKNEQVVIFQDQNNFKKLWYIPPII